MANKIVLPRRDQPETRSTTVVRVDADIMDQIDSLSYQTTLQKKEIIDILLRDALSRVELVERKVYELRLQSNQEEQEEEPQ